MSNVVSWVRKNPTLLYTLFSAVLPVLATFGEFDQEKTLGVVAAVLALVTGGVVRAANLRATEEALYTDPGFRGVK